MLFKSFFAVAAALASVVSAADLPTIEVVGNKFFYSNNGSQFYIKGVAYQQNVDNTTSTESFVDPLADPAACKRDIPFLQELQTNVIRVYALDVTKDHTDCMTMLNDAGIYVIADLSEPDTSINRDDPEWTVDLFDRYAGVVDLFHNYTNVLGFFAGNEVTNDETNTNASAYVKAAVRDTKAYIKAQGYRTIPVGYSANDDKSIRVSLADYFACGSEEERADFFGINMYEWCGSSTFQESGYQTATQNYKNLGIPIFFSEYGCNAVQPRKFQEVGTLFGSQMTDVWSGGIVYMYFQETNDYGLVSIDGNKVSTLADFNNLKSEIASISPSIAQSSDAKSVSPTSCPTKASNWDASTNLPPTPDDQVCNCMSDSLSCVVDSKVSSKHYGDLFGEVCGQIDCSGISGNPNKGTYGAYSPCSDKDKLNFVLNLYYLNQGSDKSACDFDGSASLKKATTASSCSAFLKSAGTSGLGTLEGAIQKTSHTAITNGSASTSGSGSGSGSDSSASSTSSGKKKSDSAKVSVDYVTRTLLFGAFIVIGAGVIAA